MWSGKQQAVDGQDAQDDMTHYGFASRFPRMSIGPESPTVGRTELARLSSPGVTLAQADSGRSKDPPLDRALWLEQVCRFQDSWLSVAHVPLGRKPESWLAGFDQAKLHGQQSRHDVGAPQRLIVWCTIERRARSLVG